MTATTLMPLLFRICGVMFLSLAGAFLLLFLMEQIGYSILAGANSLGAYALATFGAAAACWGLVLLQAPSLPDAQITIARASSVGFALLAVVRLMTIPDADQVFDFLPASMAVSIACVETVLFSVLAVVFFYFCRKRKPNV